MKSVQFLPEGYAEIYSIDLQKNKKMSVWVNLIAVLIAGVLGIGMHFIVPITTMFDGVKYGVMILLVILYIILHEVVHGIAMKICGTKKVRYGFTGMYAYAGSDDYYDKTSYIFIALAPIVFFGVLLAVINLLVPIGWFWVVYVIQIINLSGAAGDLFVTIKFSRLPADILVKDYGVGMHVFSNTNGQKRN